jgi:hypothetical protein
MAGAKGSRQARAVLRDRRAARRRRRAGRTSQAAAERYFPNENPIGRTIRIKDRENVDWQVVGVVGDVRNQRLDRALRPQVYVPMDQSGQSIRSRSRSPVSAFWWLS